MGHCSDHLAAAGLAASTALRLPPPLDCRRWSPTWSRELTRVLRPPGVLYAITNGSRHRRELDQLASGHWRSDQLGPEAHAFRLEDGAEQLAAGFAAVELRRRPSELAVTEVEPVVAYVRSTSGDGVDLDPLRQEVAAIIGRDGVFRIGTDVGMFVARSPLRSGTSR